MDEAVVGRVAAFGLAAAAVVDRDGARAVLEADRRHVAPHQPPDFVAVGGDQQRLVAAAVGELGRAEDPLADRARQVDPRHPPPRSPSRRPEAARRGRPARPTRPSPVRARSSPTPKCRGGLHTLPPMNGSAAGNRSARCRRLPSPRRSWPRPCSPAGAPAAGAAKKKRSRSRRPSGAGAVLLEPGRRQLPGAAGNAAADPGAAGRRRPARSRPAGMTLGVDRAAGAPGRRLERRLPPHQRGARDRRPSALNWTVLERLIRLTHNGTRLHPAGLKRIDLKQLPAGKHRGLTFPIPDQPAVYSLEVTIQNHRGRLLGRYGEYIREVGRTVNAGTHPRRLRQRRARHHARRLLRKPRQRLGPRRPAPASNASTARPGARSSSAPSTRPDPSRDRASSAPAKPNGSASTCRPNALPGLYRERVTGGAVLGRPGRPHRRIQRA